MGKERLKGRRKLTIFRIFLLPLIAIMLLQSAISIGTLVLRRTTETLEEYSSNMMNRLVENRGVILQNDMNQRWASVREREALLNALLREYLESGNWDLETLLSSAELRKGLLERLFPECLDVLQSGSTTGIFLTLTGPEPAEDFDGFFIRDSDPNTNPPDYTDLLLERGSKELSRAWNIPLDTNWTTRFHMGGREGNEAARYFYEPWRAGEEFPDADTEDLGYWAPPFCLEQDRTDTHEMITYSLPLRYEGRTYGVLGVEISSRSLYDYFPVAELNDSQQSGYLLALREGEQCVPLVGKGLLYDQVRTMTGGFSLEKTGYENLHRVRDAELQGQGIYAVGHPLRLYSNHVPYKDTDWVLLGLDTEEDLFGMSRQLYIWMVAAVLIGLGFGVLGIYLVVRHLTRPVQRLMQCISQGPEGLQRFKLSNILEVDRLYDVVVDLTEQQRKAENILLEEKERYKVALESSKDIFFSYDLRSQVLDVVNHRTMSGQWPCGSFGGSFINPAYIHEEDRAHAQKLLQSGADDLYVEFRLKWPQDTEYIWVGLTGKAVYDTDGRRWKLVGSIRNIQEQKEKEAEQYRKNSTDGVTGLYGFGAGVKELIEIRQSQPEGVMVCLFLDQIKQINEKSGIVFGDMILEELGGLIQAHCKALTEETGCRTTALRLNRDEFVLWLEGQTEAQAMEFTRALLEKAEACFQTFSIRMCAGLARGQRTNSAEQLIRMAKLARSHVRPGSVEQMLFYDEAAVSENTALPPLQEHESGSLGYGDDVSLVSVALNLFGKGGSFPEQMMLMVRKLGRYYGAEDVLVTLLRADFNSNYLNYQWRRAGEPTATSVRKYKIGRAHV